VQRVIEQFNENVPIAGLARRTRKVLKQCSLFNAKIPIEQQLILENVALSGRDSMARLYRSCSLLRASVSGGCPECLFSCGLLLLLARVDPPVGGEAPMTVRLLYCLRAVLVQDFPYGGQF
jgi:hypothetical protein